MNNHRQSDRGITWVTMLLMVSIFYLAIKMITKVVDTYIENGQIEYTTRKIKGGEK